MRAKLFKALNAVAAVVLAVLALAVPAKNAHADFIYDFEDATTQGWSFGPTTFLLGTQGLFREEPTIAVFGIDNATMSITLNLTDVATMTWKEFDPTRPPGPRNLASHFAFVTITPGQTPPLDLLTGHLLSPTNPSTRVFDLSPFSGINTITIQWESLSIPRDDQFEIISHFPGYIDEIAFLTAPEPSLFQTMGLISLIVARVLYKRKRSHHEVHDRDRNPGLPDCISAGWGPN